MGKEFAITRPLIEKTFFKLGSIAEDELDLSGANGISFCQGLIESMRKTAGLNPAQALGLLKYMTEVGLEHRGLTTKTASERTEDEEAILKELDMAFDEVSYKIAKEGDFKIWNPFTWANPFIKIHGRAVGQQIANTTMDRIGQMATNAWKHVSSPEFLAKAAPWIIGGVGGYLIPKVLGASNKSSLAGAAIGAGLVGGGKYLFDKYNLNDPNIWRKFTDKSKKFIGA